MASRARKGPRLSRVSHAFTGRIIDVQKDWPTGTQSFTGRRAIRSRFASGTICRSTRFHSLSPPVGTGVRDSRHAASHGTVKAPSLPSSPTRNRLSGSKRIFQTLPKHLRRRAANHDPKRVPQSIRAQAIAEAAQHPRKDTPKHRKRRRVHNLSLEYARRQQDKTWLETHIWHGKRTKMENLWGYRLAVYMNEKAFRSTHKASQQIALVHDASYIQRFALRGPWEAVLVCLQRVSNTTVLDFAGGRIEVQVNAYSQEGGKIAPIGVLCEPLHGHDTTVWIAVHPAAYAQVVALFQNMAEEGLSVDTILHTNHFKVIGPSSVHFLRAVLQPTTEWTQQHDYSA